MQSQSFVNIDPTRLTDECLTTLITLLQAESAERLESKGNLYYVEADISDPDRDADYGIHVARCKSLDEAIDIAQTTMYPQNILYNGKYVAGYLVRECKTGKVVGRYRYR